MNTFKVAAIKLIIKNVLFSQKIIGVKLLIENQILSPVNIYAYYIKSGIVYIEKYDNYNKRTYRNRFIISSPNGPQMISIPLKKGKNNKTFSEVEISYDTKWISNLKNTLKTSYGSSAFFEYYFSDIMEIFYNNNKYLFELNNQLRNYIFETLEIDVTVVFTKSFNKNPSQDLLDLRDKYLPADDFKIKGKSNLYPKVFDYKSNSIKNPSIIDLLFNMGKYSIEILENYPSK